MYTSGRTVKSRAAKQDLGLTPAKATRDARKVVQQVMPKAFATIESKLSYDLDADRAIVITTVTFPASTDEVTRISLLTGLAADDGRTMRVADSSVVITRTA